MADGGCGSGSGSGDGFRLDFFEIRGRSPALGGTVLFLGEPPAFCGADVSGWVMAEGIVA